MMLRALQPNSRPVRHGDHLCLVRFFLVLLLVQRSCEKHEAERRLRHPVLPVRAGCSVEGQAEESTGDVRAWLSERDQQRGGGAASRSFLSASFFENFISPSANQLPGHIQSISAVRSSPPLGALLLATGWWNGQCGGSCLGYIYTALPNAQRCQCPRRVRQAFPSHTLGRLAGAERRSLALAHPIKRHCSPYRRTFHV